MALPGVEIKLGEGGLGRVANVDDRISGLILTGATVTGTGKVTAGKAYLVSSLKEAIALGIAETGSNAYAYGHIKEFYDQAGSGRQLWLMLVPQTVSMEDMLDKTKAYAPTLLDAAKGKIRKLGVSRKSAGVIALAGGVDADVDKALIKGQALAEDYAAIFKPFRFLVDGKDFNGTVGDLKDYATTKLNRGGVLLGATSASKNAAVGLALGSMAALPPQRKIARVKNGALKINQGYLSSNAKTETLESSWGSMHDKRYIFFRQFVGKSGYFFNDDPTAAPASDDYGTFSKGFVIDKAITLAYATYVNEIGDEIEVDEDGKLNPAKVKDLQGKVESAINLKMVAAGEAGGVTATIDPDQNILWGCLYKIDKEKHFAIQNP